MRGDELNAVQGTPARPTDTSSAYDWHPHMTNSGQWYHAEGSLLSQSCQNATVTGGYLGPSAA